MMMAITTFTRHFLPLLLFFSLVSASHSSNTRRHAHKRLAALQLDYDDTDHVHALSARATLPSGWSVHAANGNEGRGCYMDYETRVLGGYSYTDGNGNGIAKCINTCEEKGYRLAGVEYGSQCFCGLSATDLSPAPSSDCDMACPDDGSESCGGSWRIQIYGKSVAPDSGSYTLKGCVADGEARGLTGYAFSDPGMTVKSCIDACSARGFSLAGVEFGQECYCGNLFSNGQGSALTPASCDAICLGDGSTGCGGTWAMSLYQGNSASPPVATPPATSPPTTDIPAWSYVGCTKDAEDRVLTLHSSTESMTVAKCLSACAAEGATYGGVEFGMECFCGKTLNGGTKLDEYACSSQCSGGGSAQCGGDWALSLWKAGSAVEVPVTTTTTKPTTVLTPIATLTTTVKWNYLYCAIDGEPRALTGYSSWDSSTTVSNCLAACESLGYTIGGVENGDECRCGNKLENSQGKRVSESKCAGICKGDGSTTHCGGDWRISLYSTLTGSALADALGNDTTTNTVKTTTTVQTTTAATTTAETTTTAQTTTAVITTAETTTTAVQPATEVAAPAAKPTPIANGGSYTPSISIPGDGSKYVWAHFIVGNAYPYTYDTWMNEIKLASANGIDGFAMNIGPDSWQPDRIRDAYNAAQNSGTGFKIMLSFDIAEFNCGDASAMGLFQKYLQDFLYHPAAAQINGKQAVTTFMGQDCSFGYGSANNGWAAVFGSHAGNIYYMPSYTSDPRGLGSHNLHAEVNWGSAWPEGGNDINTDRDRFFIGLLNGWGKKYIGTVSPCFATHMSYKNWIWRGDNFLLGQRFEQLISMRDQIDQLEVVSWNDYGESTYVGPMNGDMPAEIRYYANEQFSHTDMLSLISFYARAWKDGRWPTITQDKIWVMSRPHAAWAGASGTPPAHREYTEDNFYAQVHLTAPAAVTLCAGSSCSTKQGSAGINRFSQPLVADQGISVVVNRNGANTAEVKPNFTFQGGADKYNFNYIIKSS